jgi:hypothetical protein
MATEQIKEGDLSAWRYELALLIERLQKKKKK